MILSICIIRVSRVAVIRDIEYTYAIMMIIFIPFLVGFTKIQNLEGYVNLKSIWLECNGIKQISGLSHLKKLRMMYILSISLNNQYSYLHQNAIEKIEGLEELVNLVTINLSYNKIKKIEGLSALT
jgi:dynein assembly factor 1